VLAALGCPFSELRLQLINPSTSPNELNTTLTPHIRLHGLSSVRGRDPRVVGVFGVANLACDLGDNRHD
jgi:hypothetical protein